MIPTSNPTCRFCRSAFVVSAGWRFNRTGRKRRYRCKTCGRSFTVDDGFLRMRFHRATITAAIDLCYVSESLREAKAWLARHWHEWPRSHVSIWRWLHRFGRMVKRLFARLMPKLSGRWQADEMCLFVQGKPCWNWEVMDEGTRFWLASHLSEGWERTTRQAEAVLRLARERAKGRPFTLVTDGLFAYGKASHLALGWRHCKHERQVSWRGHRTLTNLIERKIQTTRMRMKTMRCFKSLETGQRWLDGALIHYNFVRYHESLSKTPAEAASISLKLGRNVWLGLIRESAKIFVLMYMPIMERSPRYQNPL